MSIAADSKHGITGINVTPLIDVLLVLLIIFMVIVPVTSRGLNSSIPKPSTGAQESPEAPVVIQILAGASGEATYRINQVSVVQPEMRRTLASALRARNRVVFVQADPALEYARVAEVIDVAHQEQVDTVALLTPGTMKQR